MMDSFARWWAAERKVHPAVAMTLLIICIATFALGVPRLTLYGHDVFVSLDGGWRVLHGQRPSVDFYAQMGPVYYLLHAAGLTLSGGAAEGLGYGTGLAALAIGAWSYFLLKGRMASLPFALTCVTLLLLAIAPFPLGHTPRQTAFAMKHNRYGFAITGLVLLECFLPAAAAAAGRKSMLGGFSSGFACGLLLFLKISYGMVAMVLVGISVTLRPKERARIAAIAAGFAAFVLPMLAYLRFDLAAMAREYRMTANAQGSRLNLLSIGNRLYLDRFELLPALLLGILTALLPGVTARRGIVLMMAMLLAMSAGLMLMLTNTQPAGLPLLAVAVLLLVNEWTLLYRERPRPEIPLLLPFGLLALLSPVLLDGAGLALALFDKAVPPVPAARFQEPNLSARRFIDYDDPINGNDNGDFFVRHTEEGMALARAHSAPNESIRGLGMSNPFSFALRRPPSHGGAVNISATNVNTKAVPPKDLLIGDVTWILVPTYPASERHTMAMLLATYPELLASDYRLTAESPNWKLYRRQPSAR